MRFRLIFLAPVLAFVALAGWALASPPGAAPDDDFHLVSTWCATGNPAYCQPGADATSRVAPLGLVAIACYAFDPKLSAECQTSYLTNNSHPDTETDRGNFTGSYPGVYYKAMSRFVGGDIEHSVLVMRLVNAALFVGLASLVFSLLPTKRRPNLLWCWLITTVPLGLFLLASNNPSGWAVTGIGTAWIALLGYYETERWRRVGLAAAFLLAVLMAAGSRGDSAFYVIVAIGAVLILKFARERAFLVASWLPLVGAIIALAFFMNANQVDSGLHGFAGSSEPTVAGELSPFSLFAYNLLSVPFLWVGVFGAWNLGWLDTGLPAIVPWAGAAAFIAAGFVGLSLMSRRKAMVLTGVGLLLTVIPTYVLTVSGNSVGANVQPRYLLPLIVLLGGLLMFEPNGVRFRFTRLQLVVIGLALATSNFVSLQTNIRRYVTGIDQQGVNLDAGREWWWHLPFGASAVWIVGSLAFAGVVFILLREIASVQMAVSPERQGASVDSHPSVVDDASPPRSTRRPASAKLGSGASPPEVNSLREPRPRSRR